MTGAGSSAARRDGLRAASVAMVVTAAMLALHMLQPLAVERLRTGVFDAFQRSTPRPYDPGAPVVVIDIDEAALARFGQWPWPRTYLAELIRRLADFGVVAVGFDVLLVEPDRTSPEAVAANWGRFGAGAGVMPDLAGMPSHDAVLAEAMAALPVVLALGAATDGAAPRLKAGVAHTGRDPSAALLRFRGAVMPMPPLAEAAAGIGLIADSGGADGVTRRLPMVASVGGVLTPSLSAELLRVAQGAGGHLLQSTEASGLVSGGTARAVALRTGAALLPLEGDGQFRLWPSGTQPGRVLPIAAVLEAAPGDPAVAARLQGRIALVGASASGLLDLRTTALGERVAGVTLHAEALEQVIAGTFLTRPDWAEGLERLLILIVGIATCAALILGPAGPARAMTGAGVAGGLALVLLAGGYWAFRTQGLMLDAGLPAVTAIVVYLPGATLWLIATERARRAIQARFAHLVPAELIARIAADPERALTPDGAERDLTVIFVDMRGFTTATEKLPPPEVVRLVNVYLTEVTAALTAGGATIDKFMGDAVMAFWNAPIAQPDHAARGLAALAGVTRAVARANATLAAAALPAVSVGIGLNTGRAFVGLMGSTERLSYTCIGDSVTLAARLEGLTRIYGVANCVGPEVLAGGLPPRLMAVPLDRIAVKGRSAPVEVATVLPEGPEAAAFAAALGAARAAYLARDWDRAEALFDALAARRFGGSDPRPLAAEYLARLRGLREAPPAAGWDGSHVARAKR